tara:strand:+ start:1725 stop:2102 length:378 start_codon:yes stop_codon:yes gene_type:complete
MNIKPDTEIVEDLDFEEYMEKSLSDVYKEHDGLFLKLKENLLLDEIINFLSGLEDHFEKYVTDSKQFLGDVVNCVDRDEIEKKIRNEIDALAKFDLASQYRRIFEVEKQRIDDKNKKLKEASNAK